MEFKTFILENKLSIIIFCIIFSPVFIIFYFDHLFLIIIIIDRDIIKSKFFEKIVKGNKTEKIKYLCINFVEEFIMINKKYFLYIIKTDKNYEK
jgi:hypothetical protein